MPRDPKVSYGVALLLWRKDMEDVLLIKRKGSHLADTWACPGGWVDFGEEAKATCVREAMEELGVTIKVESFQTYREEVVTDTGEPFQALSLYFNCRIVGGEPKIMEPEKCSEIRWVPVWDSEVWPKPLFPNLEDVLRRL